MLINASQFAEKLSCTLFLDMFPLALVGMTRASANHNAFRTNNYSFLANLQPVTIQ